MFLLFTEIAANSSLLVGRGW